MKPSELLNDALIIENKYAPDRYAMQFNKIEGFPVGFILVCPHCEVVLGIIDG